MNEQKKIVSRQYLIHDFYENNSFSQDYWGTCEPLIKEYTQWLIDNGYIQYKIGCEPKKSNKVGTNTK